MAIILFVNLKGGVAKTTNAVAVAESLAEEGRRVLMIDADHQCTAGELLLGESRLLACERRKTTFHDLLAAMLDAEFSKNQFEGFLERGTSNIRGGMDNLSVLPCSVRIDDFVTNMAKARRGYHSTEEFLSIFRKRRNMLRRWLQNNFDYTIVDCPPTIAIQVKLLLIVADVFIVPSIPDRLSLRSTYYLLDRIRRTGIKIELLGTLWSLYRKQNEVHRKIVEGAKHTSGHYATLLKPFKTIIPNAAAIARALQETHNPISFSAKYSPEFARLFNQLCEEVKTRLNQLQKSQA